MNEKLSFAQRLLHHSYRGQNNYKNKSPSIQKHTTPIKNIQKSKYMQFRQQHNQLKCMLKLFQNQKQPQIISSPQVKIATPMRNRIINKKSAQKYHTNPQQISSKQIIIQKSNEIKWNSIYNQDIKTNNSLILHRSQNIISKQRTSLTPKKIQKNKKKGIRNIGNTCYINAIVQCLFHLPHFNDYFINQKYLMQKNQKNIEIVEIYKKLYEDIMRNKQEIQVSTLQLKKHVSKVCMLFIDWEQQDAHQFMKELLYSIHKDLNLVKYKPKYKNLSKQLQGQSLQKMARQYWQYEQKRDQSYIYDSFCGQMYSSLKCINCNKQSQCFQNFLDLSLPMIQNKNSIQSLLKQFFQPQKLSDFYLCGNCNKSSKKSTKTLHLWRLPKFLIIHLKRSQFGKKNTDYIKINESLSLKSFVSLSNDKSAKYCQYSLCGIIMHRGVIEGGHYWCNVKQNGRWYEIDDQNVKQLDSTQFKNEISTKGSQNAYIMFYSSLHS